MVDVRIILLGLIAFSPMNDGSDHVAVIPDAPGHVTVLLQTEGTCNAKDDDRDENDCYRLHGNERLVKKLREIAEPGRFGWTPVHGELLLLDGEDKPLDGEFKIHDKNLTIIEDPANPSPKCPDDAKSLKWLPSLDRMVTGPARMRGACKREDKGCASSARFLLQQGTLSTCHLMHDKSGHPLVYDFGEHTQAVADALLLETSVRGDSVKLAVRRMEDASVLDTVTLREGSDRRITLILLNEEWPPVPRTMPPAKLKHFPNFYKLLQLLGRGKRYKPTYENTAKMSIEYSCEEDIKKFEKVFLLAPCRSYRESSPESPPHSCSECAAARIP